MYTGADLSEVHDGTEIRCAADRNHVCGDRVANAEVGLRRVCMDAVTVPHVRFG